MASDVATHHQTLEAYFFEEIEQVQERGGRPLSKDVEAYVVGLLARFARRPHAAGRHSRPLALDYLRARSEQGSNRARALRHVGDRALYISGVAPRSLNRSAVNVRYVCGIGKAAYREVADFGEYGALAVLGQLARSFREVAEVIGEVVALDGSDPTTDLLALYERWRAEGDPRDARRLAQAGVLLQTKGTDVLQ